MFLGILALCLGLVQAHLSELDTTALFDGDEHTIWRAQGSTAYVEAQPSGCFDQIRILAGSDEARHLAWMLVHGDDEKTGVSHLLTRHSFHCPGEFDQVFRIPEEICLTQIRLSLGSCSEGLELRDIIFEMSAVGKEKRQSFRGTNLAGITCTTTAMCSSTYVSYLTCDLTQMKCVVPQCLSNADCTDPKFPVCQYFDVDFTSPAGPPFPNNAAGIPRCAATCKSNTDCAHIPRFPYCTSGECSADNCRYNVDCTDPNFPVCDTTLPVPRCSAECASNDDCTHFYQQSFCVLADPTGASPGCKQGTAGCPIGTCITPVCTSNYDCTTAAKSACLQNNPMPPNQGQPYCGGCSSHQDCAQITGTVANLIPFFYCYTPTAGMPGACIRPACIDNADCAFVGGATAYGASRCNVAIRGVSFAMLPPTTTQPQCLSCLSDDDCALFQQHTTCTEGGCILPPCQRNRDCTNPALPACTEMGTPGVLACTAGCKGDDDCYQFGRDVRCRITSGTCVVRGMTSGCVENEDCTTNTLPVCLTDPTSPNQWTCTATCMGDNDCAHLNIAAMPSAPGNDVNQGPYYRCFFGNSADLKNGQCLATCIHGRECTDPAFPVCALVMNGLSLSNRYCQPGCTTDMDCTQFALHWQCSSIGTCIEPACVTNEDCGLALPRCDRTSYTCVACLSSDDCWHFASQTFCSSSGACVAPNCNFNRDCTSPLLPTCSWPGIPPAAPATAVPDCYAGCVSDDDCSQFAVERVCSPTGNICVKPACAENSDCPTPAASVCAAMTCVMCKVHDDCAHMPYNLNYCDPTMGCINVVTSGTCVDNADCAEQFPDGSKPICNFLMQYNLGTPAASACVAGCNSAKLVPKYDAMTNPHVGCAAFYSLTWCGSVTGTCVLPGCYDNNDCTMPTLSMCVIAAPASGGPDPIPQCMACKTNDDCVHFAALPICNGGVCVEQQCYDNSDCPPATPVCTRSTAMPVCTATCTQDQDCSQYVVETFCLAAADPNYSNPLGSCAMPLCRDSNDCPATKPICINNVPGTTPYAPVCSASCTSNDQCARFTYTYTKRLQSPLLCNPGSKACDMPPCISNAQCTNPAASVCTYDPTNNMLYPACVACTTHLDCVQFADTDKCIPPNGGGALACRKPECRSYDDCMDPTKPVCNLNTYYCEIGCTSDDQCAQFFLRNCANPGPTTGTCMSAIMLTAECFENYDCLYSPNNKPLGSKPICSIGPTIAMNTCVVGCTQNNDCYYYSTNVWCVTDNYMMLGGQCIEPPCLGNEDCTTAAPVCSWQAPAGFVNFPPTALAPTPTCGPCLINDDCAHYVYESECSAGVCQVPMCWQSEDCPATAPICLITPGQSPNVPNACVATCTSHDDCKRFATTNWCSRDMTSGTYGQCIQPICWTNYDCPDPNFPTCVTNNPQKDAYCFNLCVDARSPNIHNDDCTRFAQAVWCTLRGSCEIPGCLETSDCTNPAKPVCDLTQDPPKCFNVCTNNDDCNHFASNVICVSDRTDLSKKSIWGQCIVPACLRDTDCVTLTAPTCSLQLNPPKCVPGCINDDDCAHITFPGPAWALVCITNPAAQYDARRGTCEVPVCSDNWDCPLPSAPVCNSTVNPPACLPQCQSDDDCTQYSEASTCSLATGMCTVPQCFTDADCVGNPAGPACLVGARTCVQCIFDQHCSGATPACDTASNTCVQCMDDIACTQAGFKTCVVDRHVCVQCVNNKDCSSPTPSCDTFSGKCVQCQLDVDCLGSLRACDFGTNTCVQCLADRHCASVGGLPSCDIATRQCVACKSNSQCGASVCDLAKNRCVGCILDSDCKAANPGLPACFPGKQTCVACTHDSHCTNPALPACNTNTNTCVACTNQYHCDNGGLISRCDPNKNVCAECLVDSDCTDPQLPACDPITGKCTACYEHNHCQSQPVNRACDVTNRKCVECTTNSDCPTGACDLGKQVCVDCTANTDCLSTGLGICDVETHTCVACLSSKHCTDSKKPICDLRSPFPTCVQCYGDAHCGDFVCDVNTTTCVECNTAAECWLKDPFKPICNSKGGCQRCDEDIVCAELFMAYQSCHTGTGACVADSYAKGFYVAAIVLGTIAIFFVIIAVVAVIAR